MHHPQFLNVMLIADSSQATLPPKRGVDPLKGSQIRVFKVSYAVPRSPRLDGNGRHLAVSQSEPSMRMYLGIYFSCTDTAHNRATQILITRLVLHLYLSPQMNQ